MEELSWTARGPGAFGSGQATCAARRQVTSAAIAPPSSRAPSAVEVAGGAAAGAGCQCELGEVETVQADRRFGAKGPVRRLRDRGSGCRRPRTSRTERRDRARASSRPRVRRQRLSKRDLRLAEVEGGQPLQIARATFAEVGHAQTQPIAPLGQENLGVGLGERRLARRLHPNLHAFEIGPAVNGVFGMTHCVAQTQ